MAIRSIEITTKDGDQEVIELTDKQKVFCEQYMMDFNGTQAAIRAGYSRKTANEQASRLLANVNIENYISHLKRQLWKQNTTELDELISFLSDIVRSDIGDAFSEDGNLLPLNQMPTIFRRCIASFDVQETTNILEAELGKQSFSKKIRLVNKMDAIEKLMKYFGGYDKDNQQGKNIVNINFPDNGRD